MLLQDKYQEATHFAAKHHGDQKYPGTPYSYLIHLSFVSMEISFAINNLKLLGKIVNEELALICSILHDTIEDTDVKYDDVLLKFGKDIADGVMALTKDKNMEKSMQMMDSLHRIKLQPKEVWMVKLADRICNLSKPPYYWSEEKIRNYKKEGILIYNELKDANEYLAKRLWEKIENYNK